MQTHAQTNPTAEEQSPALQQGSGADAAQRGQTDSGTLAATAERGLDEIVVTARRREESAQSVPLAITSISTEDLERATVTTGTDLQKLVPTLSVGVSIFGSEQSYSLRGVRTGVVTYFNEVPIESSAVDLQLWDLASVQALAGPQGTLFGRNSTGGAVLFAPVRPTDQFEGFVEGRIGSYDLREATGVINVPIAPGAAARFGVQRTVRDGIVRNISGPDLASQDRVAARGSLLLEPNDWLSNYTTVIYAERDEQPNAQISGTGGAIGPCPVNTLSCVYGDAYANELLAQVQRGIRTVSVPVDSFLYEEPWQVTNTLAAELGDLTVRYLFGYAETKRDQLASQLSIPLPVIVGQNTSTISQETHELMLLGSLFAGRLEFVTGLYFSEYSSDNLNSYLLFQQPGTPLNNFTTQRSGGETHNSSSAIYAQGTLAITDRLTFTAGLRYTEDEGETRQLSYVAGQICALPDFFNVDRETCRQHIELETDALTYNFALDYQVTDDMLVYATTRKGYNGGGFNAAINDPDLQIVKPEFITDYEVGIKSNFDVGTVPVRLNASGFYAEYDDIQRTTSLINNGVIVTGFFNAAAAELYGGQVEITARPTPNLDVVAMYGYLHAQYTRFDNPLLGDLSGNKFAQAPEHTARLSMTYTHPLPQGEVAANVSYAYISEVTFADQNIGTPGNTAPGYGLLDLRLDWRAISGTGFDLGIYVKNATDKTYVLNATDRTIPFGFVSRYYGDPRTFGVELRYAFGG